MKQIFVLAFHCAYLANRFSYKTWALKLSRRRINQKLISRRTLAIACKTQA